MRKDMPEPRESPKGILRAAKLLSDGASMWGRPAIRPRVC